MKMLNLRERRNVLAFFRYFCTASLCPVTVDTQTWEIRPGTSSWWKSVASALSYALFVAHTLFILARLLHVALFLPGIVPLHEKVLHIDVAGAAVLVTYWYYVLHIKHGSISAAVTTMTLTGKVRTQGMWRNLCFT